MTNQYSRKYKLDLDVFYREDATSWYLLGAYMTDGNIKVRPANHGLQVAITSKDKDWLELIRDLVCKELPLYKDKRSDCYRFTISSTELGRWFISKGCIPNKSLTLKFPKVPQKYMADFIRGAIDGDGSISHTDYIKRRYTYKTFKLTLTSASKDFIYSVGQKLPDSVLYKIVEILPGTKNPSIVRGVPIIQKHICYDIIVTGQNNCQKLLSWLYYNDHNISMPRKNILAQTIINYNTPPKREPIITRGHKLSIDQVKDLKKRIAKGEKDITIANDFNITRTMVGDIRRGKCWVSVK